MPTVIALTYIYIITYIIYLFLQHGQLGLQVGQLGGDALQSVGAAAGHQPIPNPYCYCVQADQ